MKLYALDHVALILKNNVQKFMKGMASNSLEQPFNAFADLSGKVIATFPQKQLAPDEYVIVVASQAVDEVLAHVQKYGRLSKTVVTKWDAHVYFDLDASKSSPEESFCRLPWGQGSIIVSEESLDTTVDEESFTIYRLQHNLPLHKVDYDREMLLNVNEAQYVSFDKGCFLGQEVLARVHYKSKPPKLLLVKAMSDCEDSEREKMTSVSKKIEQGFLFVKNK